MSITKVFAINSKHYSNLFWDFNIILVLTLKHRRVQKNCEHCKNVVIIIVLFIFKKISVVDI